MDWLQVRLGPTDGRERNTGTVNIDAAEVGDTGKRQFQRLSGYDGNAGPSSEPASG